MQQSIMPGPGKGNNIDYSLHEEVLVSKLTNQSCKFSSVKESCALSARTLILPEYIISSNLSRMGRLYRIPPKVTLQFTLVITLPDNKIFLTVMQIILRCIISILGCLIIRK